MKIYNNDRFEKLPAAVFIDIDDTLYSYSAAHSKALAAVRDLVSQQFEIAGKNFDQVFDAARAAVKTSLRDSPSSRNRLLYFQQMFELIGVGSSPLEALNCEQTYWNTLLSEAILFPGVREFLDELRLNGVPVIALTNLTAQIQFRKLVYFDLHECFNYIVTSEQVGCEKPVPKIFDSALSRVQSNGKDVWMVGDDYKCDIEGAKRAINAVTIWKKSIAFLDYTDRAAADAEFKEFDEITKLVRVLANGGKEK